MDNTEASSSPDTKRSYWQNSSLRLWVNFSSFAILCAVFITLGIKRIDPSYFITALGFLLFVSFTILQLLKHYSTADVILPALLGNNKNFGLACNLLGLIGFGFVVGSVLFRWF